MRYTHALIVAIISTVMLANNVSAQTVIPGKIVVQVVPEKMSLNRNIINNAMEIYLADFVDTKSPLFQVLSDIKVTKIERVLAPMLLPTARRTIPQRELNSFWIIEYLADLEPEKVVEFLTRELGFVYASPLKIINPTSRYYSDDPLYPEEQWGFYNSSNPNNDINAPQAWSRTAGSEDQLIAIIDTGISKHEEFETQALTYKFALSYNSFSFEDNDNEIWWDDIGPNYWLPDRNYGHGTLSAGVLAALNYNGLGGRGMLGGNHSVGEFGASIIRIKANEHVTEEYYGGRSAFPDYAISRGISYANSHGAWAINLSLATPGTDPDYNYLTNYSLKWAYQFDIPVVAATGNDSDPSEPHYPAGFDDLVIAVGSIDEDGNIPQYSNRGWYIDVVAPTDITVPDNKQTYPDGYRVYSNTSASAPFVTGLVGMLLDDQGYQSMSSNKVAAFVRVAGQHYPAWYPDRGFGIIEANVPLDLLNDTAAWGRTHFVQGGNGYYDNREMSIYAWPGDPFPEGFYCLKRYRVFVPFKTNYGESKIAVWVEPENTNGTISQLFFFDDAEIGYAALYPPDVSTNSAGGLTRIQGNLITYVFQVYDRDAQGNPNNFLGWWPTSPSEIEIEFSTWGKLHPQNPQNFQATYNSGPETQSVTLSWNRNDPQDGVTRYQIYRRIDFGPWQHLAYKNDPPGGSTVYYRDNRIDEAEEIIGYKVRAEGFGGWSPWSSEIEVFVDGGPMMMGRQVSLPTDLTLELNYPNPFNPTTQIKFGLPTSSHVRLQIMNIRGQTVRLLVDDVKTAGWHTVTWDGKNESGSDVASGIYLYMIEADNKKILKRMTIIR